MTDQPTPSRRAGLRDEIAEALEAADKRIDGFDAGDLADAVLPVLYREWPWLRAEAEEAAIDTDTTQPEPATVTDPEWLRQQYAAAMRMHYLCTDRNEADADGNLPCRCGDWREPGAEVDDENDWDSHLADAVLAVRDRHVAQLRQRLELAAEWTPPPPGSTREQLPDDLLDLIRGSIPDYTSTACVTAGTLAVAVHLSHPRRAELWEHAERLHGRCRRNQKFTGQLCACRCHPTEEQS